MLLALIQEEPQVALSIWEVAIAITVIGISALFIAWVCYILATDNDDGFIESRIDISDDHNVLW